METVMCVSNKMKRALHLLFSSTLNNYSISESLLGEPSRYVHVAKTHGASMRASTAQCYSFTPSNQLSFNDIMGITVGCLLMSLFTVK